jgi:type II secretion system protein N
MDASLTADSHDSASPVKKVMRLISWFVFALICLIFFTLIKIPQTKIHNYVVGLLNQQLAPSQIQFSADEGQINIGFGVSYVMSGVKLTKMDSGKMLRLNEIQVSPSLIALIQGRMGSDFSIEEGSGKLTGHFYTQGEEMDAQFETDGINLGKIGVLPFSAGLEGTAEVKGNVKIQGNMRSMSSLTGNVQLNLAKIVIDQQSFKGFNLPRLAVADGVIQIDIQSGKALFRSVRLGKAGGSDDLFSSFEGDIKLGRTADASDLNLKGKLGFSKTVLNSFVLLDALLGSMKMPDGTYAFKLVGPALGTMPVPDR